MADATTYITLRLSLEEAMAVRFVIGEAVVTAYPTNELAAAGGAVYDTLCKNLPTSNTRHIKRGNTMHTFLGIYNNLHFNSDLSGTIHVTSTNAREGKGAAIVELHFCDLIEFVDLVRGITARRMQQERV